MKRVLLKPQREVTNSVLAYQDEGDDEGDIEPMIINAEEHFFCNFDTVQCDFRPFAGDCTEIIWTGNGYTISTCF